MPQLTLLRRHHELARAARQVELLEGGSGQPPFDRMLADHDVGPLEATGIQVLQINLGKLCNQTCRHCHVDAGPDRREVMSRETVDACLDVLARTEIPVVDLTGGAPEMNPHFRMLVREARRLGRHVIDRCNLTILLAPGYEDLPEFLAEHQVEIVASLPCYLEENADAQRGEGVFRKSITALKRLNELGYGRPAAESTRSSNVGQASSLAPTGENGCPGQEDKRGRLSCEGLLLTLVYNPIGPSLPPDQPKLEDDYRRELRSRYGVEFTRLYTIANMPISRFLEDLLEQGNYETYMHKLVEAFNPATAAGVMCRTMLSVDWQGCLYDCDFNQMLDLGLSPGCPRHIREFDPARLESRRITTGRHCYGCTAGAGSSCTGDIVDRGE